MVQLRCKSVQSTIQCRGCRMTKPYRKKLIEVALPLVAINAEAAREKSIRHRHPSTLHLWWVDWPPFRGQSVKGIRMGKYSLRIVPIVPESYRQKDPPRSPTQQSIRHYESVRIHRCSSAVQRPLTPDKALCQTNPIFHFPL